MQPECNLYVWNLYQYIEQVERIDILYTMSVRQMCRLQVKCCISRIIYLQYVQIKKQPYMQNGLQLIHIYLNRYADRQRRNYAAERGFYLLNMRRNFTDRETQRNAAEGCGIYHLRVGMYRCFRCLYIYTPYRYVHICVCIGRDREIYTQYIKKNVALQV